MILLLAATAFAVPNNINYQGVLRDSSGNLVTGSRSMVFSLYDQSTGGTALWSLTSSEVAVANGLYTIQLSGVTPSVLGSGDRWLETAVEGTALTPRLKLASVAYAVTTGSADYAAVAGTATTAATATTANAVNGPVSAEAASGYALFMSGRIGAANCIGTGTIAAATAKSGWITPGVTISAQSIILLSVGHGTAVSDQNTNDTAVCLTDIDTSGGRFRVGTIDGSSLHNGLPFCYLIIN